jgi:hypothetical protein
MADPLKRIFPLPEIVELQLLKIRSRKPIAGAALRTHHLSTGPGRPSYIQR